MFLHRCRGCLATEFPFIGCTKRSMSAVRLRVLHDLYLRRTAPPSESLNGICVFEVSKTPISWKRDLNRQRQFPYFAFCRLVTMRTERRKKAKSSVMKSAYDTSQRSWLTWGFLTFFPSASRLSCRHMPAIRFSKKSPLVFVSIIRGFIPSTIEIHAFQRHFRAGFAPASHAA